MRPIGVLLCDDAEELRELIHELIDMSDDLHVVGEAEDGAAGIEAAAALQPDVLVMDVDMPVMGGLEALPRVRERAPRTKVVILSGFNDPGKRRDALRLGAHDFVEKGAKLAVIVDAVRAAGRAALDGDQPGGSGSERTTTAPGSPSSIHSSPP